MTIRTGNQARAMKAKGREVETAVCEYLSLSFNTIVERRRLAGVEDCGDIAGVPGLVLECKNVKRLDLSGWLDEAEREADNADKRWPQHAPHVAAVCHKRRGTKNSGDWYVTIDLYTFAKLYFAAYAELKLEKNRGQAD